VVDSYCDTTTQKMLKTGFRGERKGILTPFTYSPIRRLLPRRGGM